MRNEKTYGCFTVIIVVILMAIIMPVIHYLSGYITGLILQWLIGETVVNGMNYLFNTTRFTVDMLPRICGTLGVIGSFFKSVTTSSSRN